MANKRLRIVLGNLFSAMNNIWQIITVVAALLPNFSQPKAQAPEGQDAFINSVFQVSNAIGNIISRFHNVDQRKTTIIFYIKMFPDVLD